MTIWKLGWVAALVLCACSSEDRPPSYSPPLYPIPGCEALDPASCDVSVPECRSRLLEIAACLRGDEPGEMPPVVEMSEAEYREFLRDYYAERAAEDHEEGQEEPAHFERALELVKLAVAGSLGVEQVIERAVENVYGLYRSETKDIFLIHHGSGSDAFERTVSSTVLVHEFVHLLQDRQLGLEALSEEYGVSFDNQLALLAMIEGEADLHRTRFAASTLGVDPNRLDWKKVFESAVDDARARLASNESPFTSTREEFPYAWGSRYAGHLFRAGGNAALNDRWAEPPQSSYEFLASVDDVVALDFTPLEIPAPPHADGWEPVSRDVLGAYGTYLLLVKRANQSTAQRVALSWRGDLFSVFSKPSESSDSLETAVVVQIQFADQADAHSMRALLSPLHGEDAMRVALNDDGALFTLALATDDSNLTWAL
jgi:hypothetical protein